MSLATGRRESILKPSAQNASKLAATLTFQWSTSAAQFTSNDESTSMILPSIATLRSPRKTMCSSLSSQGTASSVSSQKSSTLPYISKQSQSPRTTNKSNVLSLAYTQLYRESQQNAAKHDQRTRFAICLLSESPRNTIVNGMNRKLSIKSRRSVVSRPSISSVTDVSSISTTSPSKPWQDSLVRLRSPELRRMNVSEQYLNEAKTLYFNVKCRSFVPRESVAQIY